MLLSELRTSNTNMTRSLALGKVPIRVLGRDDERNYIVELDIMRSGWNENHWNFQNMEKYAKTFAMTPILIAYPYDGKKIGDGHNHTEKRDADGEAYWSFIDGMAERPVGYITNDIRTELREDGETWIVAKGIIWRFYNRELVDTLKRSGRMSVSSETNVEDIKTDAKGEIYDKWFGLGVTILGMDVAPAVPGANIHALAALENEFKTLKLRAASKDPEENRESRNNTKGVEKTMNENKTVLAELAAKFPEHRVLGASEGGMTVFLLNKNDEAFRYQFEESDKGCVVAERITPVTLSVNAGETRVASFDGVMADMVAEKRGLETKVQSLEADKTALTAERDKLQAYACERKKQDVVDTAKKRLAEFNANRLSAEQVEESVIDEVCNAAVEISACDDPCAEAQRRVDNKLMAAVMQIDAKAAAQRKAQSEKKYAFEAASNGGEAATGLDAMMSRISAE